MLRSDGVQQPFGILARRAGERIAHEDRSRHKRLLVRLRLRVDIDRARANRRRQQKDGQRRDRRAA